MHHNFDDSDSGYDVEDQKEGKTFDIGGYRGRIIFLGDGTEVVTDSDDTEMFDNSEEDKDLASQVPRNASSSSSSSQPSSQESLGNSNSSPDAGEEATPAQKVADGNGNANANASSTPAPAETKASGDGGKADEGKDGDVEMKKDA